MATTKKPLSQAEIQARIQAALAKRGEIQPKINNTERLKDSGLRIVHIHPSIARNRTGMTLAYRAYEGQPIARFKRMKIGEIEVAAAACNPCDTFSRKMGCKTAIETFQSDEGINNFIIPVIPRLGPVQTLRALFGN